MKGKHIPFDRENMSVLKEAYNPQLAKQKRNVYIRNSRTSLSLEAYIWVALEKIARNEGLTIDDICSLIDSSYKGRESLSAVIRYICLLVIDEPNHPPLRHADATSTSTAAEEMASFPSKFHQVLASLND